jgi:hypothetical protein
MHQQETEVEKRRRLGRERTRRSRDKKKEPQEIEDFSQIADAWADNEAALLKKDPDTHTRLNARHDEVEELEAEVAEIESGVKKGFRAETRTLATADSKEIFPMPDTCYRDIKNDIEKNGSTNYRQIESDAIKGIPLNEDAQFYVRYGFRLRLSHETLGRIQTALILYALTSQDNNLDAAVVEDAINDYRMNTDPILDAFIRKHRGLPEPRAMYTTLTASDGYTEVVPRSIADEYARLKIPFRSPAQLKSSREDRKRIMELCG